MPFPDPLRHWRLRASGNGKETEAHCEFEFEVNEKFRECGSKNKLQVHHTESEAEIKSRGGSPDSAWGLVVCAWHHIFGQNETLGAPDSSFHPDMAKAAIEYRKGDKKAYSRTAHGHHDKAQRGERVISGDYGTDDYYTQKAKEIETSYPLTHDDPRPVVNHREGVVTEVYNKRTKQWEERR